MSAALFSALAACNHGGTSQSPLPNVASESSTTTIESANTAPTLAGLVEYGIAVPAGAQLTNITLGRDGNMWFAETINRIGRITALGKVTQFTTPDQSAGPVVAGPDGNLWFSTGQHVARMTPSGVFSLYSLPSICSCSPFKTFADRIMLGPDNVLFVAVHQGGIYPEPPRHWGILRITTTGKTTVLRVEKGAELEILSSVAGPDAALWFTRDEPGAGFNRITISGQYSFYQHSSGCCGTPDGITRANSALWFTDLGSNSCEYTQNAIGRLDTSGKVVAEYRIPTFGSCPRSIAFGQDGNLWFTENPQNRVVFSKIGRMTTAGSFTEFSLPANRGPESITVGPGKTMWFVENGANKIAKFTQ